MFNYIIKTTSFYNIQIIFFCELELCYFYWSYIEFFSITDSSEAIKCYRCTVAPNFRSGNRTQQLCSKFSESEEFVVDCPYSTMCMKKVFRYQLQDGTNIETINRNCADQKFTEQVGFKFSVTEIIFQFEFFY